MAHTNLPIAESCDVLVIGGGAAGVSAAISAAREGARTVLVERYPHLGGLASGGMVLVLDDMVNGQEITVQGVAQEYIDRLSARGLVRVPPPEDRRHGEDVYRKWARWGTTDFHSVGRIKPVVYAAAFDPDGWKRVSTDLVQETGVILRLHSWFSDVIMDDNAVVGVITESKAGRQIIKAKVVVDTTGDLDVGHRAGADHVSSAYLTTLVFRIGGVDTDAAETFEWDNPREARAVNRKAKRLLGGSWDLWWLKTPLPGVVWANAPHMTGYDGTKVEDLTEATLHARRQIDATVDYVRESYPGFENAFLLDVAEQLGIRQTRLLRAEYTVTKDDISQRRYFEDTVARGRDYYTPYRAMLPKTVEQLIVAGRHYGATPDAQRISREIPPCMSMGQAAGVAAALSVNRNQLLRDVDTTEIQARVRAHGGDPGDIPSANASFDSADAEETLTSN